MLLELVSANNATNTVAQGALALKMRVYKKLQDKLSIIQQRPQQKKVRNAYATDCLRKSTIQGIMQITFLRTNLKHKIEHENCLKVFTNKKEEHGPV